MVKGFPCMPIRVLEYNPNFLVEIEIITIANTKKGQLTSKAIADKKRSTNRFIKM